MAQEQKLVNIQLVGAKHIMEIQLPHVFVAFPITEQGIKQIIQDCQNSLEKIENEKQELATLGD